MRTMTNPTLRRLRREKNELPAKSRELNLVQIISNWKFSYFSLLPSSISIGSRARAMNSGSSFDPMQLSHA